MNIALPALIVFLVLLPGFVVRSTFKRAERTSLDYSPFGQVVTEAVVWSCVVHGLWIAIAELVFGREFRPEVLLGLISTDPTGQAKAVSEVAKQWGWISTYFVSLLFFAVAAPALAREQIIRWRLDRTGHPLSRWLRFRNAPWYYMLTGADFEVSEAPDFIAVSAVVDVAGSAILYYGILDDFYVDQDGVLDRLVLEQVMRRPLDADKTSDSVTVGESEEGRQSGLDRFYPVDGDYFVLRYSEAITLNIEYIKLRTEEPRPDLVASPSTDDGAREGEASGRRTP